MLSSEPVRWCLLAILACGFARTLSADDTLWVTYPGGNGPGAGKHIVLVSGDEEYRSEEGLPQLGKILATHHGFKCTVLFAVDPADQTINPNQLDNIPGLDEFDSADLMIIAARYRALPDDQMKHIDDYLRRGGPVIGMRTATHAFRTGGTYAHYDLKTKDQPWEGGFGRQVLGETWIAHHGAHGKESTRGVIAPGMQSNPILRGIKDGDIYGPTDVYRVRLPLPGDSQPLVLGQVLSGMQPTDEPVAGEKNDPLMPLAWTKTYSVADGKTGRVFTTTMGASQDLLSEGFRRLLVNAAYWCVGLDNEIPERSNVEIVGKFEPTPFGTGKYTRGVKPADHR